MVTLYDRLGVTPDVDFAALRRAYHQAVRRWHPDRFVNASPAARAHAEAEMRGINAAWDVLADPKRRTAYDATLALDSLRTREGRGRVARPARRESDGLFRTRRLGPSSMIKMLIALLAASALIGLQYHHAGHLIVPHLMTLVLMGSLFWWVRRPEQG